MALNAEIRATLKKAESLRGLKRKAYRCRFYEWLVDAAARRKLELKREAGPYKKAVKENHFPKTEERRKTLHQLLENIRVFSGEEFLLDPSEADFSHHAKRLLAQFEKRVVAVLKAGKSKDERGAKRAVASAAKACEQLMCESFVKLNQSLAEVEIAVCEEAICSDSPKLQELTILSLDLAQYGKHVELLDQYLHAPGVFGLNREVAALIESGMKEAEIQSDRFLLLDTGDGALIVFKPAPGSSAAALAFRFARAFYGAADLANKSKEQDARLHFRIGLATGDVVLSQTSLRTGKILTFNMGGKTIGTSVRLQSAAQTGEILACEQTFTALQNLRLEQDFSSGEQVEGKKHERRRIPARRCSVLEPFVESQTEILSKAG